MRHKAKSDDPHEALAGEDDREDDLDFFQKLIHGICVTVWERGEHLIRSLLIYWSQIRIVFFCLLYFGSFLLNNPF